MIRTVLIGLGKMGLSHQAIINAHPDIDLVGVCDTSEYLLGILSKYAKANTYTDYRKMLAELKPDAAVIATPSKFHAQMVRDALNANSHVFCEKPFSLDTKQGAELAALAEQKKLVNQVGYHYRFVATFHEAKRLLELNAIGRVHHVRAEAYGPVVLRPKGGTWRTEKSEGGGCLYDYASHAIDLLGYLVGKPQSVSGTILGQLYSRDVEDEVYSTLHFDNGITGQLSVNWSDESYRKMYTKITLWGEQGRIDANRQEIQIYLRENAKPVDGLTTGWNMRYTTDLSEPVWYYLRGEEYSAQIAHFVESIKAGSPSTRSPFRSALDVDLTIDAMVRNVADKTGVTQLTAR